MKQIKTLVRVVEQAHNYDQEINSLLAKGWILKKRELLNIRGEISDSYNSVTEAVLYAELERDVPPYPEEITI